MPYEVIVGNIGTVLITDDPDKARATFEEYRRASTSEYGRASGENVTLLQDGEISEGYIGTLNEEG